MRNARAGASSMLDPSFFRGVFLPKSMRQLLAGLRSFFAKDEEVEGSVKLSGKLMQPFFEWGHLPISLHTDCSWQLIRGDRRGEMFLLIFMLDPSSPFQRLVLRDKPSCASVVGRCCDVDVGLSRLKQHGDPLSHLSPKDLGDSWNAMAARVSVHPNCINCRCRSLHLLK